MRLSANQINHPERSFKMQEKYKILFEPVKIGKLELKNRFVLGPMGPGGLVNADGSFNKRGMDFYAERAKGGAGLILTGVTMVENDIEKCALPSMPCPTLNPLNFITSGNELTERVHAHGAKIFLQLSSGFGRVSIPSIVGKVAVGPSPIPHRFLPGVTCRELTTEEVEVYVSKFESLQ
jgi:2-enoate reductase